MEIMKPPSAEASALANRLGSIFRDYPEIAAVYLFGSVARGTASASSDVDFGLLLDYGHSRAEVHRMLGAVAARLEAEIAPRPIDLVVLDERRAPVFCHEVLLDGRLIYDGHSERRVDFESDTISRALDFRPTLELATRDRLEGFGRWLRNYRDRAPHRVTA